MEKDLCVLCVELPCYRVFLFLKLFVFCCGLALLGVGGKPRIYFFFVSRDPHEVVATPSIPILIFSLSLSSSGILARRDQ